MGEGNLATGSEITTTTTRKKTKLIGVSLTHTERNMRGSEVFSSCGKIKKNLNLLAFKPTARRY